MFRSFSGVRVGPSQRRDMDLVATQNEIETSEKKDSRNKVATLSKALQVFHMTYRHLDDLGFLDSAATLLQVFRGYQSAQIGKTIVHAISSALLDDPMRHRILL